jgi:threonine dehydrogenase-like Zn-dependent dehydrogenase
MGEVVEVGSAVETLEVGDRVVVPFTISCGSCWFCERDLYSLCDNSNPNAEMAREVMGHSPAGLLGYSHMLGGYAGGQAEYLRVPYADVGPIVVDADLPPEQVLMLADVFPTGYMAAENAEIEDGDTVAVWGCGPVGQFAIQSATMLGADRVIAIDRVDERLAMAREHGDAETIDFEAQDVYDELMAMTGDRGPDDLRTDTGRPSPAGESRTMEKTVRGTALSKRSEKRGDGPVGERVVGVESLLAATDQIVPTRDAQVLRHVGLARLRRLGSEGGVAAG